MGLCFSRGSENSSTLVIFCRVASPIPAVDRHRARPKTHRIDKDGDSSIIIALLPDYQSALCHQLEDPVHRDNSVFSPVLKAHIVTTRLANWTTQLLSLTFKSKCQTTSSYIVVSSARRTHHVTSASNQRLRR